MSQYCRPESVLTPSPVTLVGALVLGRVWTIFVDFFAVCATPNGSDENRQHQDKKFPEQVSLLFVEIAAYVHRGQRDYVDFDQHVFRQT